jgi:formylglycine-generating enzyme required for sulfatase activity
VHYQKHDVTYEHFRRDASALIDAITVVRRPVRPIREPKKVTLPQVPWAWIVRIAAGVFVVGVGAHAMEESVLRPFVRYVDSLMEPSKHDLAAEAKRAALKAQARAEEQRQHDEAEAKRKAKALAELDLVSQLRRHVPIAALAPGSGKSGRDLLADGSPCPFCSEMVVVPAGTFTMGSPANEPERASGLEEQVRVSIAAPFAVGKFAVTFDEWDACAADGGCNSYKPGDEGWGRGKRPVINVNWDDAKAYAAWLSRKTGKTYRLLSEAEREYVTRAGTTTPFWWGSSITPKQANYDGSADSYKGGGSKGEFRQRTVPVDSFEPNPWGLYNVHGNVGEWTEDCYYGHNSSNPGNTGNPGDGRARTNGACIIRVVRGGSWGAFPQYLRSASRYATGASNRHDGQGFRLARTLSP